jgi:hypothetical protein
MSGMTALDLLIGSIGEKLKPNALEKSLKVQRARRKDLLRRALYELDEPN